MERRTRVVVFSALAVIWCLLSVLAIAPAGVRADDPSAASADKSVPREKSNCVKCHLKAGQALTEAVHTFALSVHDFAGLSCNDCHGGNIKDDSKAHDPKAGFIGTKMSAHLAKCRSCHEEPTANFAKSPHYWDTDKRLNNDLPHCVDCHGNHDVGNAPSEFSLSAVCLDCHKDYKEKYPAYAALTDANDELVATIREWRAKQPKDAERYPEGLADEIAEARAKTSAIVHGAAKLSEKQSQELNQKVAEIRKKLLNGSIGSK